MYHSDVHVHAKLLQLCQALVTLRCSLPGSSVHGILQARILEWVVCSPPEDLPDPGPNSHLLSPALEGGLFTTGATWHHLLIQQLWVSPIVSRPLLDTWDTDTSCSCPDRAHGKVQGQSLMNWGHKLILFSSAPLPPVYTINPCFNSTLWHSPSCNNHNKTLNSLEIQLQMPMTESSLNY